MQEFASVKAVGDLSRSRIDGQADVDGVLRAKARELIQSGKLPRRLPARRWGGRGSGDACMLCGKPVEPSEIGIEIDFGGNGDGECSHDFHNRCLSALELELRGLGADSQPVSDAVEAPSVASAGAGGPQRRA